MELLCVLPLPVGVRVNSHTWMFANFQSFQPAIFLSGGRERFLGREIRVL